MVEVIRRILVLVIWFIGLTIGFTTSSYMATITRLSETDSLFSYLIVILVFVIPMVLFVITTYLIHTKILNYLFLVDKAKDKAKKESKA